MNNYFGVGKADGKLYLVERIRGPLEEEERPQMIYEYIEAYLAVKERPPTGREIWQGTGIPQSLVNYWLWKLHDKGKIKRLPLVARGITLCKSS